MKNNLSVFQKSPYRKRCIIENIKYYCRCLKYAWQRATRGYSDLDLWNLDTFYLNLFTNSLIDFKENLHGAPSEFFDEEAENQIQKWEEYLEEMIQHFNNAKIDFNGPDGEGRSLEFLEPELKKGLDMMSKVFYDLWD